MPGQTQLIIDVRDHGDHVHIHVTGSEAQLTAGQWRTFILSEARRLRVFPLAHVVVARGADPDYAGSLAHQAGLSIGAVFTDEAEAFVYSSNGDMEIHPVTLNPERTGSR